MNVTRFAFWKGVARKVWLALMTANEPWTAGEVVDLKSEAVRRMIARARLDRRRESGAGIVPKFSRDPVVERRERLVEQRAAAAEQRKPVLKWSSSR